MNYEQMINDSETFDKMCDEFCMMKGGKLFSEIMRACLAHQYVGQMRIELAFKEIAQVMINDEKDTDLLESM